MYAEIPSGEGNKRNSDTVIIAWRSLAKAMFQSLN